MTDTDLLGPGSGDEVARPMTIKLSEVEKAAEGATPGPWATTHAPSEPARVWGAADDAEPIAVLGGYVYASDAIGDAAFIAASRSTIPALTAALRDVLAVSREDIDGALTCDGACHHEGTPLPECPEHGVNEAQADAIRDLYRRAIVAHVDPT